MTVFGGGIIYASDLNAVPRGLVAQYGRTSSISGVTTETGFIRIDGISVRAGYTYRATWTNPIPTWATSASVMYAVIRGSQSGSATTSSDKLRGADGRFPPYSNANYGPISPVTGLWECTTSGTLSVLAAISRATGTGTVGAYASGGQESVLEVSEVGLTLADSGTSV